MKYRIQQKDGKFKVQYKRFVIWWDGRNGFDEVALFSKLENAEHAIRVREEQVAALRRKWQVVKEIDNGN